MERAWDDATPAAKKQAIAALDGAVPAFFRGQTAKAAAMLDDARFALRGRPPTPAELWAESLIIRPEARLFDPAKGRLAVNALACYSPKLNGTFTGRLRLTLSDAADGVRASADITLANVPAMTAVPVGGVPEGDYELRAEVVVADQVCATYRVGVSFAGKLTDRVNALRAVSTDDTSIEAKTLASHARRLNALANGDQPETDFPAARLLAEAESLARAVAAKRAYYTPETPGQFWLTLSSGAPVRVAVPPAAKDGKPLPVVVALHGAGGSENMFFDTYGHGAVVAECAKRGWLLVATRAGLIGGAPPVAAVVDELAKCYPVDKARVYLVGHSMGAAHAMMLVQQSPERFAAAAALGGGGLVRKPEAVKQVPLFVGCGAQDFALGSARTLAREAESAGNPRVRFKEYADCEHIVVCQVAMGDVFTFFERKD
jgi:predicted esterase